MRGTHPSLPMFDAHRVISLQYIVLSFSCQIIQIAEPWKCLGPDSELSCAELCLLFVKISPKSQDQCTFAALAAAAIPIPIFLLSK